MHGRAATGEESDLLAQGLGIARAWGNDHEGCRGLGGGLGDRQGRSGPVELAPLDDRDGSNGKNGIQ